MPQFTINVLDSASLEASVSIREDSIKSSVFHIYLSRLQWKTYLQNNRTYRLRIPTTFKTAGGVSPYFVPPNDTFLDGTDVQAYTGSNYTASGATIPKSEIASGAGVSDPIGLGAYFSVPLTGPGNVSDVLFQSPTSSAGSPTNPLDTTARGDVGGNFGGTTALSLLKGNYIGTFRASGKDVKIHFQYILESKTNGVGQTWQTIAEDDGNITNSLYKFSWDNGVTTKNYQAEIFHNPNINEHPNLPKLYVRGTVASNGATPLAPNPAGQNVAIGYNTYPAVLDNTKFKSWTGTGFGSGASESTIPEFSLHIPKDEVDDDPSTTNTAGVDDFDTVQIPVYRIDLFSFALQKDPFTTAPTVVPSAAVSTLGVTSAVANSRTFSSLTTTSTQCSTIRNSEIRFNANVDWYDVFIDQVDRDTTPTSTPTIEQYPGINSKSFTLHGGETTFSVSKTSPNNLLWRIQTGLGTASKTVLDNVYIVPFVPPAQVQGTVAL